MAKSKPAETQTPATEPAAGRPVIVCTEHRGVFFGYAPAEARSTDTSIRLTRARMAIYFGTTKGVMQLAATGPTSSTKASAQADIDVNKVTAIFEVSPAALEAWRAIK